MSALDKALADLEPFHFPMGVDVSRIADGDAKVSIEFMGEAMGRSWDAFPAKLRGPAKAALKTATADILQSFTEGAGDLSGALSEVRVSAEGMLIVDLIVKIALTAVDIHKTIKAGKRAMSQHDRAEAQETYAAALHMSPAFWAFRALPMTGYAEYVPDRSNHVNWSWVPAFPLDQGESGIYGLKMDKPKGKWGRHNGVALKCPTFREVGPWSGCEVVGDVWDKFLGHMFTNCLAYPYWTPGLPATPIAADQVEFPKGTFSVTDPNEPLIRHQMLLLSDPLSNFQLSSGSVKNYTARFVKWWSDTLADSFVGHVDGAGRSVGPYAEWLTPDPQEKPNTGSSKAKRFYFGDDGLVYVYDAFKTGSNKVDLADYGLPNITSKSGAPIACSLASYNAVVSSSMAFLTARAEFLKNGARCQGFVEDEKAGVIDFEDFDHEIRSAIRESAKLYREGPPPERLKAKPARAKVLPKRAPKKTPRRPGRSIGSGSDKWEDVLAANESRQSRTTAVGVVAIGTGVAALGLAGVTLYNKFRKKG